VKLKLYDYDDEKGIINLDRNKLFKDRLKLINEELLSIKRYQDYYCNSKERWLGIKIVNCPHKNETVKYTLDYVSGYLLNSRDFNINDKKKLYLENLQLGKENKLASNVLYRKPSKSFKPSKNFVVMVNDAYEHHLSKCVEKYSNALKYSDQPNTHTYCATKTTNDLQRLKEIMIEIKALINESSELTVQNCNNRNRIRDIYKECQNKKDVVDEVKNLASKIKINKKEVKYIEIKIHELYEEYYFITEGRVYK
jgi:hypothetical protein